MKTNVSKHTDIQMVSPNPHSVQQLLKFNPNNDRNYRWTEHKVQMFLQNKMPWSSLSPLCVKTRWLNLKLSFLKENYWTLADSSLIFMSCISLLFNGARCSLYRIVNHHVSFWTLSEETDVSTNRTHLILRLKVCVVLRHVLRRPLLD